jgi:xanthosine phosphorylase
MTQLAIKAAEYIRSKCDNFQPKIGLILGSGLGMLAELIKDPTTIYYGDLPGFPISTVAGHAGQMVLGYLEGVPVVCLQGRAHWYEGIESEQVKTLVRTIKLLGCESVILTNAAGSLRMDVGPGRLMLITDHINMQGKNPLIGPNDEEFGPRFFAMDDAYNQVLRKGLLEVAEQNQIKLAQGVYISVLGPCFETPAEIRSFRTLGADAVGMSTVSEVIAARHCGLKVAAISAVTNYAAGMSDEAITHEGTLHYGKLAAKDMSKLLVKFFASMAKENG